LSWPGFSALYETRRGNVQKSTVFKKENQAINGVVERCAIWLESDDLYVYRVISKRVLMKDGALPIVLVVLGAAWLLHSLDWLPEVRWIWILGLAGTGLAILMLDGVTKSSIVAGPLLILAGLLSFFHQYYGLGWRFIIPIMLIAAGTLMLVARSPSIPESRNFNQSVKHKSGDGDPHA
jgi:hypothetical protein